MLWASKPAILLHLTRDSLLAFDSAGRQAQLALGEDTVRNLEVTDSKKLGEVVAAFAATHKLRGQRAMLALDDSVIFSHITPQAAGTTDALAAEQDFESKLPLEDTVKQVLTL